MLHVTHDTWHVTPDTWHLTRDTGHVTPDMWHVTSDMWHVTCDTWWGMNILSKLQLPSSYDLGVMMFWRFGHLTRDMWHVTCDTWCAMTILSKCQLSSSYGLGVLMFWRSGGKASVSDWINEWMSCEVVCRTAPATPGLLQIIFIGNKLSFFFN